MVVNVVIVVLNVWNLFLDGLFIDWNQIDIILQEWKYLECIENGKMDKVYFFIYDQVKMAEFYVFYGYNIGGGYFFVLMAKVFVLDFFVFVMKGFDL